MLSLRKANEKDIITVFNWANDPIVRANAFNPDPITFKDHEKWFMSRIKNPATLFLILEKEEEPVGQIRYELEEDGVVINYMIGGKYRGAGLGTKILSMGEEHICLNQFFSSKTSLVGYVKKENIPSIKAFEKAGYKPVINNHPHHNNAIKFEKLIYHENRSVSDK